MFKSADITIVTYKWDAYITDCEGREGREGREGVEDGYAHTDSHNHTFGSYILYIHYWCNILDHITVHFFLYWSFLSSVTLNVPNIIICAMVAYTNFFGYIFIISIKL